MGFHTKCPDCGFANFACQCIGDYSPRPAPKMNQAPSLEKIVLDCIRHMKRVGTYHHLTNSMRQWFENESHVNADFWANRTAKVKRYWVFAFSRYYPSGGISDFMGQFSTLDEAEACIPDIPDGPYDRKQIVDMQTMNIIERERTR